MATDKLKVMLSFMREINNGNIPNAGDYGLVNSEYWDIIEACQGDNLIKGARFSRGKANRIIAAILDDVKLTVKGLEYLHEHSKAMQTYKGLKEFRDWFPF